MNFLKHILSKNNKSEIISLNHEVISIKKEILKHFSFILNLKKKNLIFIFFNNNHQSILCYLATIASGNVAMLIDENTDQIKLQKYIKNYKPNYLFTKKKDFLDKDFFSELHYDNYNLFKINKNYSIHKDLILLLPTSGTTGSQKFVRISKLNLNINTQSICKIKKLDSNDICITTMPFQYTFGMSIVNSHIFSNSKIILNNDSLFNKIFWQKMIKFKVSNFGHVPFGLEILRKLNFKKIALKSLRLIYQAGGKLDDELWRYFVELCEKKKIDFIPMYGATEATSRMSFLEKKFLKSKIGCIGKGLDNTKMYLSRVKKGKGEIIFEGKNVSMGYANNFKDLSKGNYNKYKLFTKDIGYYDEDKYIYIIDRNDQFIKINGIRINILDIQNFLKTNFFGTIAIKGRNRIIIFFDKKSINQNLIKKEFLKRFEINPNNVYFKFIKKIPTINNKINYKKLKQIVINEN